MEPYSDLPVGDVVTSTDAIDFTVAYPTCPDHGHGTVAPCDASFDCDEGTGCDWCDWMACEHPMCGVPSEMLEAVHAAARAVAADLGRAAAAAAEGRDRMVAEVPLGPLGACIGPMPTSAPFLARLARSAAGIAGRLADGTGLQIGCVGDGVALAVALGAVREVAGDRLPADVDPDVLLAALMATDDSVGHLQELTTCGEGEGAYRQVGLHVDQWFLPYPQPRDVLAWSPAV